MNNLHETCSEYVKRRLTEGWKIISQSGFNVTLQSPEGILRPVDLRNDIETLRPNAVGDYTLLAKSSGTYNWEMVDEEIADDYGTRVYSMFIGSWRQDLYNLPASSGSETINKITLYFRVASVGTDDRQRGIIKSDTTETNTSDKNVYADYGSNVWHTYSQEWAINPADSGAWEWADIDALQIGVGLYRISGGTSCTQVYVEVDYGVSAPTVTTQAANGIGFD